MNLRSRILARQTRQRHASTPFSRRTDARRRLLLESLEQRSLLATIQGTVFHDLNANALRDPSEPGQAGVTVYLDANNNGAFDQQATLEPDLFPPGTVLNTAAPGVVLSVLNQGDPTPFNVTATTDSFGFAPTGQLVLGHENVSFFNELRQLQMTFTQPVDTVSIDFAGGAAIGTEAGRLEIYASDGTLLDTYVTQPVEGGVTETMSLTRPTADIAYAIAYTNPGQGSFGRLDNLRFGDDAEISVVTASNGNYAFTGLAAGDYVVREIPPADFAQTNPAGRVFAANTLTNPDSIVELDPSTGAFLRTIPAPLNTNSSALGMAFDGQTLFYLQAVTNQLFELDPESGDVRDVTTLPAGTYDGLAVLEGMVYLAETIADDILVFDPVSDSIVRTLDINAENPGANLHSGLGETESGRLIATTPNNDVIFINPETGKVTGSFNHGVFATDVGVTSFGGEIYLGFSSASQGIRVYSESGVFLRTLPENFPGVGLGGAGSDDGYHVRLTNNGTSSGRDFGNQRITAEIHGVHWSDIDGDGKRDPGEPPMAGVVVYLDQNNDGIRQTGAGAELFTTTAADGTYSFTDLAPGDYVVRQEAPANHDQTYPQFAPGQLFGLDTFASPDVIREVDPLTGAAIRQIPVPLAAGSSMNGLAFDGQSLYFVSDSNDLLYQLDPATGAQIGLPKALPSGFYGGVARLGDLVYVFDSVADDLQIFNPATNTFDMLDLNGLNPGISFSDPLGELPSTGQLLAATSSQILLVNATTGRVDQSFNLAQGFLPQGLAGVGNEIFVGFSGGAIDVYDLQGNLLRSMTSSVRTSLGGYAAPDDAHRVSLAMGQSRTGLDFGNDPDPAEIRGEVFSDSDGDGVRAAGEPPLAGAVIYLDANNDGKRQFGGVAEPDHFTNGTTIGSAFPGAQLTAIDSNGNPFSGGIVTARTDSNSSTGGLVFGGQFSTGWWRSTRLRIDFDQPVGAVQIDAISDFGSDVGRLEAYNAAGELLATLLTGTLASDQFQTLSLARAQNDIAYVIADSNNSSLVKLDHLVFGDGTLEQYVTSAADGGFVFANLDPGDYVIRQDAPENYTQTLPAGDAGFAVPLGAGQIVSGLLFGSEPERGEIRGEKWRDNDGDGRRDENEPPLAGVVVYLDANDNGALDAGEVSTLTAQDGTYAFTGLLPGEYAVREIVPAGFEQTYPVVSSPRLFASDVFPAPNQIYELDPATGAVKNSFDSPLPGGQIFEGLAFDGATLYLASDTDDTLYQFNPQTGLLVAPPLLLPTGAYGGLAAIDGRVYLFDFITDTAQIFDVASQQIVGTLQISGFNIQDAFGEMPLTGELLAASSDRIALIDAATGNVTGEFPLVQGFAPRGLTGIGNEIYVGFANQTIDVYDRQGNLLRTLTQTPDVFGLGGFGNPDDAHRVSLSAGQTFTGADFGNQHVVVDIHGAKFDDLDADGQRDPGEPPLAGVTIYLDVNDNNQHDAGELSTQTTADGSYAFLGLPAGSYIVREVVPPGYVQTAPRGPAEYRLLGTNFSRLAELDPATGTVSTVQTASGFATGLDTHPTTNLIYAARSTLEVFDTTTGTQTSIGTIRNPTGGTVTMNSISFAPDGTLYGLSVANVLYTIDPQSAVATQIGSVSGFVLAIEFGPDGTLYSAFGDLFTIDPGSGARLQTIDTLGVFVTDLDFAPDGTLYGLSNGGSSVYTIDPASGDVQATATFTTFLSNLASQATGPGPIDGHRVTLIKGEVRTGLDFGNHNDPPTAAAGGPYLVQEGSIVPLNGSGSDPQEPTSALSFVWDLDGDGLFGEIGTDAAQGDEIGPAPAFSSVGLDGPSDWTVTLRVVDSAGAFAEDQATIHVDNVAPTIDALQLSAASIDENGTVSLTIDFSDPGLTDTHQTVIAWGDGTPDTIVDLTGGERSLVVSHQYLDDNPSGTSQDTYSIQVSVADGDGPSAAATTSLEVKNVAPVLSGLVSSATTTDLAEVGEAVSIAATFTDVGTLDTHTAVIDWGDGTTSSGLVSAGSIAGSHAYAAGGVYTITVTLSDDDLGSVTAATTAVVSGVGIVDGQLQIVGTEDDDHVSLNLTGNGANQTIRVHASFLPGNGQVDFPAAAVSTILIKLFDGDDHASLAGNLDFPTLLDGGAGDDHLDAGRGPAILLGGLGDDHLNGGEGNDILIGGLGDDHINGSPGEDVLIAGNTTYDDNDAALLRLLAEWSSPRSRSERVANLRTGGGPLLTGERLEKNVTVFDDASDDHLNGASGDDWYFFLEDQDHANVKNGEEVN